VFGVSHASMLNPPQIGDLQVAGVPSAAFAPRDRVSYLGASRAVLRMSSASVVTGHLDAYQRGAIPDLDPAVSERLVAFHLPLDGGATNDLLSAEIRVTERWTYAR